MRPTLTALVRLFQVVPPCGGHPAAYILVGTRTLGSSRAPVWGASFFAPSRGHPSKFQVLPPGGGHPDATLNREHLSLVSSRAPVWGASRRRRVCFCWKQCFKSCPRVGGILLPVKPLPCLGEFQVVPPGGGHPFLGVIAITGAFLFQVVPPCGGHLMSPAGRLIS